MVDILCQRMVTLQVVNACQGGQCVSTLGLHLQCAFGQAGSGGQFVLIDSSVGLSQQSPESGGGLQVLPAALACERIGLAEEVLRLGMLALTQADQSQVPQALSVLGT